MNEGKLEYGSESYDPTPNFTDPVCGMVVEDENDALCYEHGGIMYSFCSEHCLSRFKEDPTGFLEGGLSEWGDIRHEKPLLGRPYTCPVHKGVIQDCPGRCLQCGTVLQLVPPFSHT